MNILLANMPIEFNKRENLEPPLGICYIASMLKKLSGVNIFLRDYEVNLFSEDILGKELEELKIDVIGISFRTASFRSAKEFVKKAKNTGRDIFIAAGGHHATAFPKETLAALNCNAVVVGEGEYTFKELIERLIGGISLEGLKGLVYKSAEKGIIENRVRPPISDIDALPWPARELLNLNEYNVITFLTSRGCPFECIYCDKSISTRKVKFRSAGNIFSEIKHIAGRLNRNRLYIVDDHFFLKKNRTEHILDKIIGEKLSIRWTCQARVDGLSENILKKAKHAGCEQIMYGVETGDQKELEFIRKNATLKDAENALRLTKKAGITARANFMLGFPVSTEESMRNTINFARKLNPDIVRFFAVSPLPNTDLWTHIYGCSRAPGGIKWEDMDFFKPSFDIAGIKREKISLYVSAAYWHVLGKSFLKEISLYFFPNLMKLLYLIVKTGKIRGNISKSFPRSVNLILDNMHQVRGKRLSEAFNFLKKVYKLEKTL